MGSFPSVLSSGKSNSRYWLCSTVFGDSTISASTLCCKHSADRPRTTGWGSPRYESAGYDFRVFLCVMCGCFINATFVEEKTFFLFASLSVLLAQNIKKSK